MKKWLKLILCIIAVELIGIAGGFFTSSSVNSWYSTIIKPSFNPPIWLFGPVWTILYAMIGLSLFLFLEARQKSKDKKKGYWIFGVQLLLNFMWSIVFFGMQQIFGALIVIALLWIFILLNILAFYKISKVSGWLLVPYWLWVSFASVLNFALWQLNIK
mgnify:CR=1 FL=1